MRATSLSGVVWQKASFSGGNGGNCVELAVVDLIAVRDSKDPNGPVLLFTRPEWKAFTDGLKAGEFASLTG